MGGRLAGARATAVSAQRRLAGLADPGVARQAQSYFKTGPGEYGEGDVFRGLRARDMHRAAREFVELPLGEAAKLLDSRFHEDRALALLILVLRFERGGEPERRAVYELYVRKLDRVNNWDLVDSSADHIVGGWLADRSRAPLVAWAKSDDLWERRVAIIATARFIHAGEHEPTLRIARLLLHDDEDLIHKAVGWMLREVGKRDLKTEEGFLKRHYKKMPRTMLRYAIERFSASRRRAYLEGTV